MSANAGGDRAVSAVTDDDRMLLLEMFGGSASTASANVSEQVAAKRRSRSPDMLLVDKLLDVAALLHDFDPHRLLTTPDPGLLSALLPLCAVSSTDGRSTRWVLRLEERQQRLRALLDNPDDLARAGQRATAYHQVSGDVSHAVTRLLWRLLDRGSIVEDDVDAFTHEELSALRAVLVWVTPLNDRLQQQAVLLLPAIDRAELLEPFRFLTGWSAQTGRDTFVGREDELERLRSHVDVLAASGLIKQLRRSAHRLISSDQRILAFSGVGGVGKSTLLAKFILEHTRSAMRPSLFFGYLDFDRSSLQPLQPVTMLLEMLRQLAAQYPAQRAAFVDLRDRVRAEVDAAERVRPSSNALEVVPELVGHSLQRTFLSELARCCERDGVAVPLLLVIDTFEEVQLQGEEAVRRVDSFVKRVQALVPSARLVVSGRDEATEAFAGAQRFVVTEFRDLASREEFLARRGVPRSLTGRVARQVGGRPLSLHLAARLVREHGPESIEMSVGSRFRQLFDASLIDGVLYGRILEHIKDTDVQQMVHPGLVLRRLDVAVLREVVAPVLGRSDMSEADAERIMSQLRLQKDLVRIETDGSVTHRADVREQMLKLMRVQEPERTIALHVAGAAYHERAWGELGTSAEKERHLAEACYHWLSLGERLETVMNNWTPSLKLDLARAVREIDNPAGRGTLKVLLDRTPTDAEWRVLPPPVRRTSARRSVQASLDAQSPEQAFERLRRYDAALEPDDRAVLSVRVHDLRGDWDAARDAWADALEHHRRLSDFATALEYAGFIERDPGSAAQRAALADTLEAPFVPSPRETPTQRANWRPLQLETAPTVLRLRRRAEGHERTRPALESIDPDLARAIRNGTPLRQAREQWMALLTSELEDHEVLPSLVVLNDTTREQLGYLRLRFVDAMQQREGYAGTVDPVIGVGVCDLILMNGTPGRDPDAPVTGPGSQATGGVSRSRKLRSRVDHEVLARDDWRLAMRVVMRCLLLPSTPEWYIPLAAQVRQWLGPTIHLAELHPASLPPLPFDVDPVVSTTRDLADLFRRLDRLGVLVQYLEHIPSIAQLPLLQAYREWRADIVGGLDEGLGRGIAEGQGMLA